MQLTEIQDKMAIMQVIGCLLKQPSLVLKEEYKLEADDFPERFHAIVFSSLSNLVKSGVQEIDAFQIEEYLSKFQMQYNVFNDNKGVDYLIDIQQMSKIDNFEYYYKRLKKFSLLREYFKNGISVADIFDTDEFDPTLDEEKKKKFNDMSLEDITNHFDLKFNSVKMKFNSDSDNVREHAGEGMAELIESLKETPDFGAPLQSKIMNTILRGARKKKLYMRSAPTGFSKTRDSIGDICMLSIPEYYDIDKCEWIHTGMKEASLFITTELEPDEIRTAMLACISCVQESHILDGAYEFYEEERVQKARKLVEDSDMHIVQLPNHSMEEVESTIKDYKLKHNVGYVFFDYVFVSVKMLSEMAKISKGIKMREDNVLLSFVDNLKRLCNKLDVFILTSSQVNGSWESVETANQNILSGSKAMANKLDAGWISMPVTKKDIEMLQPIIGSSGNFMQEPNRVYHIYKIRRGKLNFVKVWIYADAGVCRTKDLFVTKNDYTLLTVKPTEIISYFNKSDSDYNYNSDLLKTTEASEDSIQTIEDKTETEIRTESSNAFKSQSFDELW